MTIQLHCVATGAIRGENESLRVQYEFQIDGEWFSFDEGGLEIPPDAVPPEAPEIGFYSVSVTVTDDTISPEVSIDVTTLHAQLHAEQFEGEFADYAFELAAGDDPEWGYLFLPAEVVTDDIATAESPSVEVELAFDRETTLEKRDWSEEIIDEMIAERSNG